MLSASNVVSGIQEEGPREPRFPSMCLVLRGHVRTALQTPALRELVASLGALCFAFTRTDLHVFVHTWNVTSSGLSWRTIPKDLSPVTTDTIHEYLHAPHVYVHTVLIEDDAQCELHGNVEGIIPNTRAPLLGWKRYLYGNFQAVSSVTRAISSAKDNPSKGGSLRGTVGSLGDQVHPPLPPFVINTRFDVLHNSNSLSYDTIVTFVTKQWLAFQHVLPHKHTNTFVYPHECYGIDNLYVGTPHTMWQLAYTMHTHLDTILTRHTRRNQECLVFCVNKELGESGVYAAVAVAKEN